MATCAHVVSEAFGEETVPDLAPGGTLRLDLPFAPGLPAREAHVWRWWPPQGDGTGDIALLRLIEPVSVAVPAMRRVPDLWGRPFRVAGFPPGHEDGLWSTGVMRAEQGSGWVQLGAAEEIGPGFSGAPVWDSAGQCVLAIAVAADRGWGPERSGFALPVSQVLSQAPELLSNPYRGLAAFGEDDSEFFYGRVTDVARCMQVLETEGLLVVAGGSGAGKSSLVSAGIVPAARARGRRLARARLTGVATRDDAARVTATALAAATAPGAGPHGVTQPVLGAVSVEGATADDWAPLLRHPLDGDTVAAVARARLLLVVDQLEDLAAELWWIPLQHGGWRPSRAVGGP